MDWIVSNWDQVGAYNLGTAVTGLILVFLCLTAFVGTSRRLSRYVALAFSAIGLYMLFRGAYWFVASQFAPVELDYHPAFTANLAHTDDWRWLIWLVIAPMELALLALYMRVFEHHGKRGIAVVGLVSAGYLLGGFL